MVSDRKIYKEFNDANYVSMGAKLAVIQHFKVEEYSKPVFENIFDFHFAV